MRNVKRSQTTGLLASLIVLSACGAPPRRLADEPRPAPYVRRISPGAEARPPVIAVVPFTTTIAPGTNLGGNFDDDGVLKMRQNDNRMIVWEHARGCALSDEIMSILEFEAGVAALPSPNCWPGVAESEHPHAVLAGTLEDLTLNSFADPGRVDVEVMVVWELFDRAGECVYRASAYGFMSLEIAPAVLSGGAVELAVGESLRRVLVDDDFAQALRTILARATPP